MRNTQRCTHSHAYHAEKHQPVAASQSSERPHRSVRQSRGQCLTPVQTTVKLQLHPLLLIPRHAVGDRSLTSTNQTTIPTPAHRRHQHLRRTETQRTPAARVFATSQMSHMYSNPPPSLTPSRTRRAIAAYDQAAVQYTLCICTWEHPWHMHASTHTPQSTRVPLLLAACNPAAADPTRRCC
jgi:hypothetical protein